MKICTICSAKWRGQPSVCPLDGGVLEDLPDPLLGRTIAGRYVISERIGAGGMGTVYRARHEVVGRDVAIKFLSPELAGDLINRSRFLREAKAANRIDHEHIIDITDYGETTDGLVYLVMEYLDGGTLADVIATGAQPPFRAVDLAQQMASALGRAHELDVIHRDIKPDNVFVLDRNGRDFVVLLDFGLAKMKGEIRLTASGAVFGTPDYMAPEQARGAPITGKADLYALGCILYEMLTGAPPFRGPTPDLILQHIREAPVPPSQRVSGLPPELDAAVLRLLEKEPERRYRDAYHLYEDLRSIATLLPRARPEASDHVARAMSATFERFDDRPTWSSSAGAWDEKVERFRALSRRAHGGTPPDWLEAALGELEECVGRLALRRADLDRSASGLMKREEEIRGVRLNVGKAIDVLVRDESRAIREIEELVPGIDAMGARREVAEASLRDAWARHPASPGAEELLDFEAVERLRRVGRSADEWATVDLELRSALHARELRERERNDLRFQVAQLKGRLGSLNAEGELDLAALRDRTLEMDVEVQSLLDRIAARSEEVVKHLLEFPQLRDAVRAAGR